jgi:hypothetical protein
MERWLQTKITGLPQSQIYQPIMERLMQLSPDPPADFNELPSQFYRPGFGPVRSTPSQIHYNPQGFPGVTDLQGGGGANTLAGGTRTPHTLTFDDKLAIHGTATRLGISPQDLAAVIHYETIGTMNPHIIGGKGNNYVGLIQFGRPERRAYGYKPGMTFAEEVRGPVHNYLKDRGLPPGANISTIYRTVNGGNPKAALWKRDGPLTLGQHIERIKAYSLPLAARLTLHYDPLSGQLIDPFPAPPPDDLIDPAAEAASAGRMADVAALSSGLSMASAAPPIPQGIIDAAAANDFTVPPGGDVDELTRIEPVSYTPRTPNVPPTPPARPYQPTIAGRPPAGEVGAMPAAPAPIALRGTASTGAGMGASAVGPEITIAPTPPPRPPVIQGGGGVDNIGHQFRDTLGVSGRTIAAAEPPISGGGGGDLVAGVADTLTPLPRSRPSMASGPPMKGGGGTDTLIAGNAMPIYTPPPAPEQAPTESYTPYEPRPPEQVAAGSWLAPMDSAQAAALPRMTQGEEMASVADAYSTPMYKGGQRYPTTSPLGPELEPELGPEPDKVQDAAFNAPPPAQTHRSPTGPQSAPSVTMATAPPVQNWIDRVFSNLITRNTGGSRGFVPGGIAGVSPGGYKYKTGGNVIGTGGQYVTPGGQTITYVQDDHFGQPGYLTGYG